MTRTIATWVALCFASTPAAGQLVVTPFDPQRTHGSTSDPVLMTTADGKLLMRLNGMSEDDSPRFWSSLYVLDRIGNVLERIDLPDDGVSTSVVVPYRNGFIVRRFTESTQCNPPCGRYIPGRSELVYYDLTESERQPIVIERRIGTFEVLSSHDRNDLYRLGAVDDPDVWATKITRLDASFKTAWSRTFSQLDTGSVIATGDGVAFTQYKSGASPDYVLRAIGRDGLDRWEISVPHRANSDFRYLPAGILIVPAGNRESPLWVNAKTGAVLPDVDLPPRDMSVPTQDGLLIAGPMLGQSYAAMVKPDGAFAWTRRFNKDSILRTFKDGIMTSDGRLLLVAEGDFSSRFTFLSVDRYGEALERERSACLTVPSPEAFALGERLKGQAIYVVPPNAPPDDPQNDSPVTVRSDCPVVTETHYMAFMVALLSELPPATSRRWQVPQVAVRLLEKGEPSRLVSFGLGYGGWLPRRAYAEFQIPFDKGAEFARYLTGDWHPQVTRLERLQDEFRELTRFKYGASIKDATDFRQALVDLEHAALQLNEVVKAMPPHELTYVLETQPNNCIGTALTPDGFGTGYDDDRYGTRPLADAEQTLLHIAGLHRKANAEGNICLH